jgi:CBS domain-containing protein
VVNINARSPVRTLIAAEPVTVSEKLTLRGLAAVLAAEEIGTTFVRRGDGSPGIVSERDVIRALANGADPDEVWAADVMTEELVTALADERIIDVAIRLVAEDIRHAAVLDEDHVIGVVSARDLFRVVTDELLDTWTE